MQGEDSDAEDFIIRPDDNLLVAAHVEDDTSSLEVYSTNILHIVCSLKWKPIWSFQFTMIKKVISMFITISSCSTCHYVWRGLTTMLAMPMLVSSWKRDDIGVNLRSLLVNYVAVGSMEGMIELFDVDVVDQLEPLHTFGKKPKKKKAKASKKASKVSFSRYVGLGWALRSRKPIRSRAKGTMLLFWT